MTLEKVLWISGIYLDFVTQYFSRFKSGFALHGIKVF